MTTNAKIPKSFSYSDLKKMRKPIIKEAVCYPFLPEVKIIVRTLTSGIENDIISKAERAAYESDPNATLALIEAYRGYYIVYESILKYQDNVDEAEERFFDTIDDIKQLPSEEFGALLSFFNALKFKYNPSDGADSAENFENLIKELKKNSMIGKSLNLTTQRKLLFYLIDPSLKLLKANGYYILPTNSEAAKYRENMQNETIETMGEYLPEVGIKVQSPSEEKSS